MAIRWPLVCSDVRKNRFEVQEADAEVYWWRDGSDGVADEVLLRRHADGAWLRLTACTPLEVLRLLPGAVARPWGRADHYYAIYLTLREAKDVLDYLCLDLPPELQAGDLGAESVANGSAPADPAQMSRRWGVQQRRLLKHLAERSHRYVTSSELAGLIGLAPGTVRKLMTPLREADLVVSRNGTKADGYRITEAGLDQAARL